jgi:hypothetical protein
LMINIDIKQLYNIFDEDSPSAISGLPNFSTHDNLIFKF